MVGFIFSILLFILPLVMVPIVRFPYELPKVIVFQVSILLLAYLVFSKVSIRKVYSANSFLFGLVGLVFVTSLIGFATAPSVNVFFGNVFRAQGVFLLWNLLALIIITVSVDKLRFYYKLHVLTLVGLLISSFFLIHPLTGRSVGTLGEANALAAAAVFLWPFSLIVGKKIIAENYVLGVGSFAMAVGIVFASGSRAGIIALIIQVIFIVLVKKFMLRKRILVSIICILMGASLLLPLFDERGIYEKRTEIWQTAFVAGFNSPIIGVGFGNISSVLHETSIQLGNQVKNQSIDSAHNILLDWWVQGGIVGLAVLVILLFKSILSFLTRNKEIYAVMLIGVVAVLLFNPASVITLFALSWLIGIGFRKSD